MKKKNVKDWLVWIVLFLVSRLIFPFLFVDFKLGATVVKTNKIRHLKELFSSCFFLTGKFFSQNK